MPLQNRVDPYGQIRAIHKRGKLMGNRGLLHNSNQQLVKPFQLKRWIICVLDFKNRKRQVMRPRHYTELFFSDEPSALAAGHRPCAECQRDKFNAFKKAWSKGNSMDIHKVEELDAVLHVERISTTKPKKRSQELPNGVFVEYENQPHLVLKGKIYPWTFEGYGKGINMASTKLHLLTPESTLNAIQAGYLPDIPNII